MKQRFVTLLLLGVALLLPREVEAQEFNIFAKQRVVVWDIRDRNDRPLSDGVKQVIRQGIIDVCTNSGDYEVYEVNIDDIKRQLSASGQQVNFANICKKINRQADFIIFTEVKTSSSAIGSQDVTLFLSSSLYRIETATEVRADNERAEPTSQAVVSAASRMISRMLGIDATVQSQSAPRPQQPAYQQSAQPQFQSHFSHPQPAGKKIGDIIYHNGVMAIVIAVDSSGQHGILLSVDEIRCDWDSAKSWCANLGVGWKLPSRRQLQIIYQNKTLLNTTLKQSEFEEIIVARYWSSDEYDSSYAWGISMGSGLTDYGIKYRYSYVRAVSFF